MRDSRDPICLSRRSILKVTGSGTLAASFVSSDVVSAAAGPARLDEDVYPGLRIARLSSLREGHPVAFAYPLKQQPNLLVKIGERALRGVGPQQDVVAFSVLCTHMGGSLRGAYRHREHAIGPCPFHFSTFDLRKGGIPVHASATQNLPQVVLRIDGDDVIAIGVVGLVYGYRNNLADGDIADGARSPRSSGRAVVRT